MPGPQLDPRFDPRFQRGGAGAATGAPSAAPPSAAPPSAAPPSAAPSTAAPSTAPPSAAPASAAPPTPWPIAPPPASAPPVAAPADPSFARFSHDTPTDAANSGQADDQNEVDEADAVGPTRRRGNPWVVVLFVVSALLLAGGLALIWRQATVPYDYATGSDLNGLLDLVSGYLPPAMFTGGLVGLAIAGATLAVLGSRRR